MSHVEITEQIKYIGADDKTLDLFESQYLIPNGVSEIWTESFREKSRII